MKKSDCCNAEIKADWYSDGVIYSCWECGKILTPLEQWKEEQLT